MHQLHTQIEIRSSPERVWSVLMDFAAYPTWNPFVRSIAGNPAVGEILTAFIQPPDGRGMTFRPKVLVSAPAKELRWIGSFPIPGLFNGEHYFQIEPGPGNRVIFHHGEKFTGLLIPFMKGSLEGATKRGFLAMNEALKREAER